MRGDGDRWVFDPDGARYWCPRRRQAAARAPLPDSGIGILLQHRAVWSHRGRHVGPTRWARDSHETVVDTAIREADEEAGISHHDLVVRLTVVTAGR